MLTNLVLVLFFLIMLDFIYFYFCFRDANTIFRGNSLATRCLDEMMKIVGGHYLKVTLKPILDEVQAITIIMIVGDITAVCFNMWSLDGSDSLPVFPK